MALPPGGTTALPHSPLPFVVNRPPPYHVARRDAECVGVDRGAVVQQHARHGLPVLLQVEGLVPVAPALVVLVARAVDHGQHDGYVQVVVVVVLHVPGEHRHGETGVLRETSVEFR